MPLWSFCPFSSQCLPSAVPPHLRLLAGAGGAVPKLSLSQPCQCSGHPGSGRQQLFLCQDFALGCVLHPLGPPLCHLVGSLLHHSVPTSPSASSSVKPQMPRTPRFKPLCRALGPPVSILTGVLQDPAEDQNREGGERTPAGSPSILLGLLSLRGRGGGWMGD